MMWGDIEYAISILCQKHGMQGMMVLWVKDGEFSGGQVTDGWTPEGERAKRLFELIERRIMPRKDDKTEDARWN